MNPDQVDTKVWAEAVKALDQMDAALRLADTGWVIKAVFVWGQRRDYILAGEETWEDQRLGEPTLGGHGS